MGLKAKPKAAALKKSLPNCVHPSSNFQGGTIHIIIWSCIIIMKLLQL